MKILKFGARWCPRCKTMTPRWQEIEKEYPWLKTEMIEIDDHPDAVNEYRILEIPTFIFFDKEGKEVKRFSGIVEKEILTRALLEEKDK